MKQYAWLSAGLFLLFTTSLSKPAKETVVPVATLAFNSIKTVEKYHYAPRPVNDSFSAAVYRSFWKQLDPFGLFFTVEAVGKFDGFKFDLDDQIRGRKTTFLDAATAAYAKQLGVADSLVKVLKTRNIDFTAPDTLWLGGDSVFVRECNLLKRWEQWVKYMALWSYRWRDSTDTVALPGKKEMDLILQEVVAREACRIQEKKNQSGGPWGATSPIYLKSIANVFDPHTQYLSSVEKDLFEADLSAETGMFGIRMNFNTVGEIEISAVQPGGPAWHSNRINEGDVILNMKKGNSAELDLRCVSLTEVQRYLASIKEEKTVFRIRKKNGKIINVSLRKEIIGVEENTIQSLVLKGSVVAGYVYLPSFYTDYAYGQFFSKGCANDLTRELIKLKAVPIQGLILDLRSNGGGSMWEAIRMAGIFIDNGALCITHTRGNDPETVKDIARGTVYGGPLVVLVNSFSASAAELLAGCLQDLNRAVIIGSTTYGKSTAQSMVPVNAGDFDSLSHYKGTPPGYLALTMSSLYRVTGQSHQKSGVVPDIELPELWGQWQGRESSYDNVLEFAKINKKAYYYPLAPLPRAMLKSLSEKRVVRNTGFGEITKIAPLLPRINARYPIPLTGRSFKEYLDRFDKFDDTLAARECPFTAKQPAYAKTAGVVTGREKEENDEALGEIREDRYIAEAYYIMNDLINHSTKSEKK